MKKIKKLLCALLVMLAAVTKSSPFLCVNSSFSYIKYVYAAFIFSNVL